MAALEETSGNAPAGASLNHEEQPVCSTKTDADTEQRPTSSASASPVHPISQLQGPFEESIAEAAPGLANQWVVELDAQTRRRDLLENDEYERLCGRKWRQRSTEKYHPFWKLVSQMVFGVHLLAKRQAKSPAAVMKILQSHVDELDGFLQRTTEDFLIIHLDVRTRIQYLSLPLGNLAVFDEMLEDRNFRLALVSYNDQIEHAVERFTLAITDALKDLRKGKEAMGALWHYLQQLGNEGCFETDSLRAFYQAMMENMEGWVVALSKLRRRGSALQKALGQLAFAVTEMQRRVGVASRRDVRSLVKTPNRAPSRSMSVRQRLFARSPGPGTPGRRPISEKPLPRDPLSKPKSRPASRNLDAFITEQRNTESSERKPSKRDSIMPRVLNRARSCSALIGQPGSDTTDPSPPRTPSRLTRKLSRPFLPKRSVSDKTDTNNRPSTAPAQTLKTRSASIEQLKALWGNGRPRTQQSMAKQPQQQTQPQPQSRPQTSQPRNPQSEGLDTMKDQIWHFLKTDRVVEAWDNIAKTANCCGTTLAKTKEWPSSIFRTKSSENLHDGSRGGGGATGGGSGAGATAGGSRAGLSGTNHQRQMSWIQEPEFLSTYSFKQRPAISPRIHVLSIAIDDELEKSFGAGVSMSMNDDDAETGSIITALPAVPAPTPAPIPANVSLNVDAALSTSVGIPSVAEYTPRTVGAQA
ncbi:uncharacterized protein N7496_012576 [Penicillium cataractarum]|uniref:Uncharacterized protein n=1 Tax=Penicillium cataractarum TaxID=2100454 RepID=A0A9W9R9V3_9EURO|nr:uncharacterized protein N7496_012576 [Penicillium cataractarum]KAJ5355364.1 hypothetical protein N7496_012576 [Penicillium cataractarum]